jgi:hypothetical protein
MDSLTDLKSELTQEIKEKKITYILLIVDVRRDHHSRVKSKEMTTADASILF